MLTIRRSVGPASTAAPPGATDPAALAADVSASAAGNGLPQLPQ